MTIEQKILTKGHTEMEVDSMHWCVEKQYRHKTVSIPAYYTTFCLKARLKQPHEVHYLEHYYFRDYSKLQKCKSIRPGNKASNPTVTDIVTLQYENINVFYKLNFSDESKPLPECCFRRISKTECLIRRTNSLAIIV